MITSSTILTTENGDFLVSYHKSETGECMSFSVGDIKNGLPLVRIHSSCLFGESIASCHCDCRSQLNSALEMIQKNGNGVIIYSYQEGRGIGLENKITAMEIQRLKNIDTVEAFHEMGLESADVRSYIAEINALNDLGTSKMIQLMSGNQIKIKTLENNGYVIKKIIHANSENLHHLAKKEIQTKKDKMNYSYE